MKLFRKHRDRTRQHEIAQGTLNVEFWHGNYTVELVTDAHRFQLQLTTDEALALVKAIQDNESIRPAR